jgi:hypothetical protein
MTGRGWTAALLLFAVLFVHGLQCGSAADGAAHLGADPMVSLGVTAAAADEADRADATAPHASPLAAALAHGADQMPAGAVLSSEHGGTSHPAAGHLWAVCSAVLAAGLAVLIALVGSRLVPRAPAALARTVSRAAGSLPLPRPPDLHALCLQRT